MTDAPIEREKLISLDDLLAMGDARVEIIDGEVKIMAPAGFQHHFFAGNVYNILNSYVTEHDLGVVMMDGLTYLMFSETSGLKDLFLPDVSFIHKDDFPADWDIAKPFPGVPTLAVEVMSPDDKAIEIQAKVRTYLSKGTQEVWLIYPAEREIHQFRGDDLETARIYTGSRPIDVSALFPELTITTDEVFHLPKWVQGDAKQNE